MESTEDGQGQEGCNRADAVPDKGVPGPGGFLVWSNGVNEDRRAEAREQPRLLERQAKSTDDPGDDERNPSGVQGRVQLHPL